ncbi:hypothetical protein Syun_028855 [Stephania yunnanensis]|uniref:Lysine-specific demethylase JMJ25 n=1 Tax=Stephania yunnanensis TaxID=152371 RepID=A0AAP0HJA8_9MAGN
MDHPRSVSGNGEDNVGIPEDLRCKRSDGKQWRCSAMSMPDKTVCEKHYIQAKKRAANSALRASLRKGKRKPSSDDIYSDDKFDDLDTSPVSTKGGEYSTSISSKKYKEIIPKIHSKYSPETTPSRNLSSRNALNLNEDVQRDIAECDDNRKPSYRTPKPSGNDLSRNKALKNFDASEQSDESMDFSDEDGGLTCHQCQRSDGGRVFWCQKCDRRGYCDHCISKWYPNMALEDIQKVCPACREACNCKVCLRVDNLIKARLREISVSNKLKYLHCLLSSILPVIKQIHADQCFEKELETKIYGAKVDVPRARLHADEQMCCNCCRAFIVDYHRHCANCLYDLCLNCCKDLRQESLRRAGSVESFDSHASERSQDGTVMKQGQYLQVKADRFCDWKANSDGSIPCPPKGSDGCGCTLLTLRRIFKLNWVAKLVKNVEEMVNGCRAYDMGNAQSNGLSDSKLNQVAYREDSDDNFLYCPASEDIKHDGVGCFQKHWTRGEPVIVKQVCDVSSGLDWDPMVIWRGVRETTDEKTKEENRTVKAIDCLTWSEVDIELVQFIKGYTEGRIHENGWPEMLKLKDWPSPSSSEEFLSYQRPEFISKLPLLEYIHSKWGLLNVAAKLPHYSLQNDVGPRFLISYGTYEELGKGDSVTNLQTNMFDMVYLLMHTFEVRLKGWQPSKVEKIHEDFRESDAKDPLGSVQITMAGEGSMLPDVAPDNYGKPDESVHGIDMNDGGIMEGEVFGGIEAKPDIEMKEVDSGDLDKNRRDTAVEKAPIGAIWDIFRRQDVPRLIEYLRVHFEEFRHTASPKDSVVHPLFDNAIFLNKDHKRKLKDDLGIEPWTVEQHQGEAVFIPAGCPFQVRNLQSSVQLVLDFLSPESLKESVHLAEEIRSFPNDHEAKFRMLEVGKMSLYAASSAIREVQKLALDPKVAAELGIDDPNLTALVSENLEKMIRRRQIACV